MSLANRPTLAPTPSIGIDAVDISRYSDVHADDGELLVFDEKEAGAWIQSDTWIAAKTMA